MEEKPELSRYVCMYKNKRAKRNFEKCSAHSARSGRWPASCKEQDYSRARLPGDKSARGAKEILEL